MFFLYLSVTLSGFQLRTPTEREFSLFLTVHIVIASLWSSGWLYYSNNSKMYCDKLLLLENNNNYMQYKPLLCVLEVG